MPQKMLYTGQVYTTNHLELKKLSKSRQKKKKAKPNKAKFKLQVGILFLNNIILCSLCRKDVRPM